MSGFDRTPPWDARFPKRANDPPSGRGGNPADLLAGSRSERLGRLADLALGVDRPTSAEREWLSRPENRRASEFLRRFRAAIRAYRVRLGWGW